MIMNQDHGQCQTMEQLVDKKQKGSTIDMVENIFTRIMNARVIATTSDIAVWKRQGLLLLLVADQSAA